jgi:hypothetical protein
MAVRKQSGALFESAPLYWLQLYRRRCIFRETYFMKASNRLLYGRTKAEWGTLRECPTLLVAVVQAPVYLS